MSEINGSAAFQPVTHVIFDLDGLLLDTEVVYEEVISTIAAEFGKTYPLEVKMKILGTTEQRSAALAVQELQLPITTEEYLRRYRTLCHQLLPKSVLMNGAQRLLRHLHAHNVPICLATSSSAEMVQIKTAKYRGIFHLLNHNVCGSSDPEVKEGKPAPDIFLIAANRFPDQPAPNKCLVFEDSPNGIIAANAAGMQSVMVPDPRVPQELRDLATLVLDSLEDFKPELFGLPAFDESP